MADVPAAVCDTHALLFHAAGGGQLGRRAAAHFDACERRQAIVYVPAATIWECGLLARGGRINPAYQPYDLTAAQIFVADETRINRDPFDALICAAAIDLELPLITRDADIRGSGVVKTIW